MVETLKELDIEYVAANPGSSFEGLQESLVNYGDPPNTMAAGPLPVLRSEFGTYGDLGFLRVSVYF